MKKTEPELKPETLSHNDHPNIKDGFDQADFINEICQLIVDTTPPKGMGVNGYWGTGKTTALLNIYCRFNAVDPWGDSVQAKTPNFEEKFRDKKIIPIWFEAWRFQHEQQPIIALLHEIKAQLGQCQVLKDEIKKIGIVTLRGIFNSIDEVIKNISGGLMPTIDNIQKAGEKYEAENYLNPLPSQAIQALLENAISAFGEEYKLLILIDDLDRCRPNKALQLMEGIKIHLNLKNCIILFGMDQRQVEQALISALNLSQNIYNEQDDVRRKYQQARICHQAQEYLEKICQDIHHIPVPNQSAKTAYFIQLLQQIKDLKGIDINEIEKVLLAFNCLPANPRKIKTLVNRLALILKTEIPEENKKLNEIAQTENKDVAANKYLLMIAIAIIYTFHRRVYQQLEKNKKYMTDLISYAENPDNDLNVYEPMRDIIPSIDNKGASLPKNPSDSNIFRLHKLLKALGNIRPDDLNIFLKG